LAGFKDRAMTPDNQQVLTSMSEAPVTAGRQLTEAAKSVNASRKPRIFLPIVVTAGLLWGSYFPLNLGWLGSVALIPFLILVRIRAPAARLYPGAFLAGLLSFIASLQWMRVADYRMYATWIGLAIACALFFPLALFLVRRLDQRTRLPLIVTFP